MVIGMEKQFWCCFLKYDCSAQPNCISLGSNWLGRYTIKTLFLASVVFNYYNQCALLHELLQKREPIKIWQL